MPDVALAHRPGVELVNTGSWQLLSGSWNPNRKDILAAVESARCPAVRRPKLKLGHLDPRFNGPDEPQFDGTPSLGWFDNLRASDDGNTLIGDQVALPWLSQVQAAAYPDRSVEGTHNARCALGHVHPFVVTAVSLLGETPPGIPTLKSIKSIDDLPAALGVAASGEDLTEGESVQATVRAAEPAPDGDGDEDDEPTGVMVALIPTAEDAARLVVDGGEPAEQLHLTLAYLGDASNLDDAARQDLIDVVSSTVNGMPVIDAAVFSAAIYNPGDATDRDTCLVYQVSGDLLDDLQDSLDDALGDPDFAPEPWFAHITAIYSDDLARLADLVANVGPVSFDRVRIAIAGQTVDIPLIADGDSPDPSEFDDSLEVPNILMPVAAASADKLRAYWVHGKGALKIRWGEKNDFYRCVAQLRKYVTDPKGLCNTYHREALGVAPGQERVHAAGKEPVMAAAVSDKPWDPKPGEYTPAQWKAACLVDSGQGNPDSTGRYSLPVREPDGTLNRAAVHAAAGRLSQVKASPDAKKAAAAKLLSLYGDLGEKPPPSLHLAAHKKVAASSSDLPAAEPEQPITDPKEGLVSTELSALRSRLGLDDAADLDAITAAVDELKAKADTPAEPTSEMVAASAAATEKAEKATATAELMKEELTRVSSELAEIKASAAATVKAGFFGGLVTAGKLKPADRETWEARYDRDPQMVSEILGARAEGSEVPVMASGSIGSPEPTVDDDFDALVARIDAPTGKAA